MNKHKKSLYPTYASWIQIPAGEQSTYIKTLMVKDPSLYEEMIPAYVTLRISEASAESLGNLTSSNTTLAYRNLNQFDHSTDQKKAFIAQVDSLKVTIDDAKAMVEREIEAIND